MNKKPKARLGDTITAKWVTVAETVNHPPHYTAHPSGVECIDVVEHMSFNIGNAVKYLWRCGLKGDHLEDLQKARWYIEREIAKRSKAITDPKSSAQYVVDGKKIEKANSR